MAQLTVKPAAGQKLKLQRHTGADAVTLDTHGNVQVAGTITSGTITNSVAIGSEPIKKFHHFTYGTRTTPNSSRGDKFTWTQAFTPIDPINNSFHVHAAVPIFTVGNDHCSYGLRIAMTQANAIAAGYASTTFGYTFVGKGIQYCDGPLADRISMQQYNFVIEAGIMKPGTYVIFHYYETDNSQAKVINPSTTDQNRFDPATSSELMIIEYGNY